MNGIYLLKKRKDYLRFRDCLRIQNRKVYIPFYNGNSMNELEKLGKQIKLKVSKKGFVRGNVSFNIGEEIVGRGYPVSVTYNFLKSPVVINGNYDHDDIGDVEIDAIDDLSFYVKPYEVIKEGDAIEIRDPSKQQQLEFFH